MALIDLRSYIVASASHGTWLEPENEQQTKTAARLILRWQGDTVVLQGQLRVRVSLQSENLTYTSSALLGDTSMSWATGGASPGDTIPLPAAVGTVQSNTVYSYVLEVPAGQVWPFEFQEVFHRVGNNFGMRLVIEPAIDLAPATQPLTDLPCDFAVANQPNVAQFFPAACEPCPPGTAIGLPPGGPALGIPVADGGCIRPRFFNGMFITKEDMETEQRYFRLKSRLHNRAQGEGVVWGFNVGKAGNQVCVLPGYGVDCCGNDLTLTSVYRVDIATLLRDPAAIALPANVSNQFIGNLDLTNGFNSFFGFNSFSNFSNANQAQGARMHLLLEYVECPSDPRPVHADPCAGTASRCEMSRIRESVRLRLVPPRDLPVNGPLKTFLERVAALRALHPLPADPATIGAAEPEFPFVLRLEWDEAGGGRQTRDYRPDVDALPMVFDAATATNIRIWPSMDGPFLFTGGSIVLQFPGGGDTVIGDLVPRLDFEAPVATINPGTYPASFNYTIVDWRVQTIVEPAQGTVYGGKLDLEIEVADTEIRLKQRSGNNAEVLVLESPVGDPPCEGEPCLPPGADAVLPHLPWLHDDPVHPDRAGDPKALILAALGAWLTKIMAAHEAGTDEEDWSSRRLLATTLYEAVWLLFYGIEQGDDTADTQEALRNLFRDWCEAFLYKGPMCKGAPHGVVIGCTTVTAGSIGDIDPFGGRRWVMHYPLLSHWTTQLGMAPLDVMASRMLSSLCCVASQPSIGTVPKLLGGIVMETGGCFLTFGPPDEVADKLRDREQIVITQTKTVTFAELVVRFIGALGEDPAVKPDAGATLNGVRYTLGSPMNERVLSLVCVIEEGGE